MARPRQHVVLHVDPRVLELRREQVSRRPHGVLLGVDHERPREPADLVPARERQPLRQRPPRTGVVPVRHVQRPPGMGDPTVSPRPVVRVGDPRVSRVEEPVGEHRPHRRDAVLHRAEGRRGRQTRSRARPAEDDAPGCDRTDLPVRREHVVEGQREPHPRLPDTRPRPPEARHRSEPVPRRRDGQPLLRECLRDGMRLGQVGAAPEEPAAVQPEQRRRRRGRS